MANIKKFIIQGSSIIDPNEVIFANLDGATITIIFKNYQKPVELNMSSEKDALEFITSISNYKG